LTTVWFRLVFCRYDLGTVGYGHEYGGFLSGSGDQFVGLSCPLVPAKSVDAFVLSLAFKACTATADDAAPLHAPVFGRHLRLQVYVATVVGWWPTHMPR
jgi:hypothetical protein